ncbi:MAG TPA: hypothetical protein VFB19_10005 [Mycobacterium sp.]|nr:hypothetical protein [Mycobacterium sp.]
MTLVPAACAGFLLAVLWMDLIFDVQVLTDHDGALDSIAAYYRRATTTSRPMSALIVAVMLILLGALGFRWASIGDPVWLMIALSALALVPIVLALLRTVPNAVRLGSRADDAATQTRLALAIFRDHVLCFGLMLAFLGLLLSTS